MKVSELFESEDALPTPAEFKAAAKAAMAWNPLYGRKSLALYDHSANKPNVLWNPLSRSFGFGIKIHFAKSADEFLLKVTKDGAVKALTHGTSIVNVEDFEQNIIVSMHTDPTMQAALQAKMGTFRLLTMSELKELQK